MKKLWLILVLCVVCVFCAIGFAACDFSSNLEKSEKTIDIESVAPKNNNNDRDGNQANENDDKYQTIITHNDFSYRLLEDGTYSISIVNSTTMENAVVPSEYNGIPVTSIGYKAFYWCNDSLKYVTIPDSVTSIGEEAFHTCYGLTSITIGNSVTSIGDHAFQDCSSLTSITIPDSVTSIGNWAFDGCRSLESITIGNSVTSIGKGAFEDCSGLASITIPDSVTSIGEDALDYCGSLTNITVDENNNNYKSIDGNLYSKDGKTLIKYATGKTATEFIISDMVTTIDLDAFSDTFLDGCNLKSITIPESVTNLRFTEVSDLCNVEHAKTPSRWVHWFYCWTLKTIEITSGESIKDYALAGASELESVIIPDSVTSIGSHAFDGCSSLTSITIPDSVTSIGSSAFNGCSNLESIKLSKRVTSIEAYAFCWCSSLTSVTIPDSVTSIEGGAFWYCSSLTSITYNGATMQWQKISKNKYWSWSTITLIHCTDGDLDI